MKKQVMLLATLFVLFITQSIQAQTEINLVPDTTYLKSKLSPLSIKKTGDKLVVKYISFPAGAVKSSDEGVINGNVVRAGEGIIQGSIAMANIVMLITEQEIHIATQKLTQTNNHLVALRNVDANKTY